MATFVELPQMTDTMSEGILVAWLAEVGDSIRTGDPLAEVETDKAIMELEAPKSGVLLRKYAEEGAEITCGTIVVALGDEGEDVPATPPSNTESATPNEDQPDEVVAEQVAASVDTPAIEDKSERVKASPVARSMASDEGLDLSAVVGSGPDGRIVKRDVEKAISERTGAVASSAAGGGDARSAHIRRRMIDRLVETHQSIPTFTVTRQIDMGRAVGLRGELRATESFVDGIGYTEMIVKAAALAMRSVPQLNARYSGDEVVLIPDVNIGIAVGLDDSVVVPVVKQCDTKPLQGIVGEMAELAARAHAGALLADDVRDSTFTVSNLGMYGVDSFTAMLNAPDAAILACGSVREQPVVRDGSLVVGTVMFVTLTVDHRVADGVAAAKWLAAFAESLENPVSLIV
jgi:pyruvate dehydrogenase E2 component (dihydrolipoamide acetyltransferase)